MSANPTALDLRFDWPELRLPIFFIVDDPAPCLNLAFYEQYFEEHVRDVPNSFTSAWADLIEEFGVRGKFTVLPVPAGIGRADRPLPDVAPRDQEAFMRIMRDRVSPLMDIGIEFLTHWHAWDLRRDRPVDYTEKTMGPHTSRAHLTEYLTYGLRILCDLGLKPTGVTSPGASCREIEWHYQAAVRDAVRDACGLPIAWYFLHVDDDFPVVLPRIKSLEREKGEACVTMVSMAGDPMWRTQFGEPSPMDEWITADGQKGRLADLFRNGSVIGFHTHWQSLFSNGRAAGLADFRVALSRIREHFGERVRWTKCSDLARIVAAQAVTRPSVTSDDRGVTIALTSTIACPDFTCRLPITREPRAVSVAVGDARAGSALRHLPSDAAILQSASWRWRAGELAWCAEQPAGTVRVRVDFA